MFDKFDVDVNGTLDKKEIKKLMIYCGYNPTDDFIKQMDQDGKYSIIYKTLKILIICQNIRYLTEKNYFLLLHVMS